MTVKYAQMKTPNHQGQRPKLAKASRVNLTQQGHPSHQKEYVFRPAKVRLGRTRHFQKHRWDQHLANATNQGSMHDQLSRHQGRQLTVSAVKHHKRDRAPLPDP